MVFGQVRMIGMKSAICREFENAYPQEKTRHWQQIGMIDRYRSTSVVSSFDEEDCPLELIVDVKSELQTFNVLEIAFTT